jgi:tetratricopeptide (TPR) repeat protein
MRPLIQLITFAPMLAICALAAGAHASDNPQMDAQVRHIDDEWARIKYRVKDKDDQLKQIETLAKEAAVVVNSYPGRAEPLLWEGIVTSEEAALANVFHQLGLARQARTMFEKAEAIDPKVLNGAVTMSLGVIYYRVPGFPIAFGDDDIARHYLEAAVAMDPGGLDSGYFYGDFLIKKGEYDHARAVLQHALEAPADAERAVWDAGRRVEIRTLLASIDKTSAR